jgi:branched-chain amino acid transport system permease protein
LLFEQLVIVGLVTGAVYSLVGVGFTLVLGIGKIANFAHGSFVGLGLYLALFAHNSLGMNAYEAFIPAMIVFAVLGALVAELFEWRGRRVGEIGELLIGLALLLLIGGLLEVIFTDNPKTIQGPSLGHVSVAGLTLSGTQLVAAGFTLVVAVALYLFVRVSRWGRALRAVADNAEAAGLYGVRVPVARRAAVVISIMVAGAAGMLISPFTVLTPDAGSAYLISAFAVVIVGGIGNTLGAVLAGIGIGLANSLASGYLASYWTSLAPLIVILLVLLLRPGISDGRTSQPTVLQPTVLQPVARQPSARGQSASGRWPTWPTLARLRIPVPAVPWIALGAFFIAAWLILGALSAAVLSVLVLALYYGAAASSFNLLYGSLGVFSLAQPVFVAIGGYTGVYLYIRYGVSPWLSIFVGMAVAGIIATPIGLVAMRRPGTVITALVTLIVLEAAAPVLSAITPLGGAVGMYLPVKSGTDWGALQFATNAPFARIFLTLNVVIIAGFMWLRRSRLGLWLTAIRDSPDAASACGIPVPRVRMTVFIASAMVAAVPGVIYAQFNLLANADLFLGTAVLFQLLVVALVGGSARPWGSLVGAVVITELSYYLTQAAGDRPGIGPLTFAAAFLVMALALPRGISGGWASGVAAWYGRSTRVSAAVESGPQPPQTPAVQAPVSRP